MRCTGACCREIKLWGGGYPVTLANVLAMLDRTTDQALREDTARLKAILTPVGVDERGQQTFRCRAFDGARCLIYDDRPTMCTNFPNGSVCHECGARSDAEARGVALTVREVPVWRHPERSLFPPTWRTRFVPTLLTVTWRGSPGSAT